MPRYDFINKETKEVTEVILRMSEYDNYIKDNPLLERYYGNQSEVNISMAPPKIDGGMKEVLTRIKTHHHGSTINV